MKKEDLEKIPLKILYSLLGFYHQKKQKEQTDLIEAEFKQRGIDIMAKIEKPKYKRLTNLK